MSEDRRCLFEPGGNAIITTANLDEADQAGRFGHRQTEVLDLARRVNGLTLQGQSRLALALGIFPAQPSELFKFVSQVKPTDYGQITEIRRRIDEIQALPDPADVAAPAPRPGPPQIWLPAEPPASTGPVGRFPFGDCRYFLHPRDDDPPDGWGPFHLTEAASSKGWTIGPFPDGRRVVIQCFQSGHAVPRAGWPVNLRVCINGSVAKPRGRGFSWPLIDLSEFDAPYDVRFEWRGEYGASYLILVRGARFRDYSDVAGSIQRIEPDPAAPAEEVGILCPITHKTISCPGRGIHCKHRQCFDLETFLRCAAAVNWHCPICARVTPFTELRSDPDLGHIVAHPQPPEPLSEVASDEFASPESPRQPQPTASFGEAAPFGDEVAGWSFADEYED
jgi:hypothetical protein